MSVQSQWSKSRPRFGGMVAGASVAIGLALMIGCGGGGGGGGGGSNFKKITEDNAAIDVAIAGQQAVSAGIVAPFTVLQETAPPGVFTNLAPNGLGKMHPNGDPVFVPSLNLYAVTTVSGKNLSTKFYDNQNQTGPEGTMTATGSEGIGSTYTYPVQIDATVNITGGNIPMSGGFQIMLLDSHGKNTIKTHDVTQTFDKQALSLPKNMFVISMNLSGDDSLSVAKSDTIDVNDQQFGIVCHLTNLSGSAATKIKGDLNVDPQKWTGSGTIDLTAGTFSMSLTDDLGKAILSAITNGTDAITLPSGLTKTIDDPNSFITSVLATGSGGTTAGSTSTSSTSSAGGTGYAEPVPIAKQDPDGSLTLSKALGDGEIVGTQRVGVATQALYWSTPTATPVLLTPKNSVDSTAALGISAVGGGTIVGSEFDGAANHPCYWQKKSGVYGTAVWLPLGSLGPNGEAVAVSSKTRTIVGDITGTNGVKVPAYWDPNGTLYPMKSDGRSTDLKATGIDDNYDVLGGGYYPSQNPVVWLKATVSTSGVTGVNAVPQALPGIGLMSGMTAQAISDNGIVVGGSNESPLYWSLANGIEPHLLPQANGTGPLGVAYGITADGAKATGLIQRRPDLTISDMCVWTSLTKQPIDVSTQLTTTNYNNLAGFFLLSDGSIVGPGIKSGETSVTWLYTKAK
ncbi:MAG TPA: hypothetical protein VG944_15415 [Fimbriimonas sp.]|nr:hypothetical protein [Fimbriimonas sp.]